MRRDGFATLTHQKYRRKARSTEANPKTKCDLLKQVAFCFGSGRRIRTLTYGVRVRCATFTQSRCVLTNKLYYTRFLCFVNTFFKSPESFSGAGSPRPRKAVIRPSLSQLQVLRHEILLQGLVQRRKDHQAQEPDREARQTKQKRTLE